MEGGACVERVRSSGLQSGFRINQVRAVHETRTTNAAVIAGLVQVTLVRSTIEVDRSDDDVGPAAATETGLLRLSLRGVCTSIRLAVLVQSFAKSVLSQQERVGRTVGKVTNTVCSAARSFNGIRNAQEGSQTR